MERLQKVIAECGYASRRKAEELIKTGHVYVNGEKVTVLGTKVNGNDDIVIDGVHLNKEEKETYILYKPAGYVSTVNDDKKRKTVVDLIDTDKRIYPIGRLDYDTTGLLLLTNDGELANTLMHPSNHVEKTYIAKLDKIITVEDIYKLKNGVVIDGIKCLPTRVKLKHKNDNTSTVEITIVEGRNHIVKRVFSEIGYKVVKLKRTTYAFLTLDNLKEMDYRKLTVKEVKKLYNYENK